MYKNSCLLWGLFCLRISLSLILIIFAVEKILLTPKYIDMITHIAYLHLSSSLTNFLGIAELLLGLLFLLGIKKSFIYCVGLILQIISSVVLVDFLANDWENWWQHLLIIPLTLAFLSLFLMRNIDNKWIITKKKSIFS
jgi:uncharacterized membrane protein YphA (DoxX/SURF4 family)